MPERGSQVGLDEVGRLCFMVVVPPLCSILFGVESRGYYFSIHGFLHFTCSVLKVETDQRYFAFMFKGDHWECLLSSPHSFFLAGMVFPPSLLWKS